MSFNKRIIKKSNIIRNIDNLEIYFHADSLIISDEFSMDVLNLYNQGKPIEEIKQYIKKNENEY